MLDVDYTDGVYFNTAPIDRRGSGDIYTRQMIHAYYAVLRLQRPREAFVASSDRVVVAMHLSRRQVSS